MTVAFIGSVDYQRKPFLIIKMCEVLLSLINNDGADVFLFAQAGQFDNDFYTMVSQLKERYTYIETHYHHGGFDYDIGYINYMEVFYDKVFFPPMGTPLLRDLRNRVMIDKCDVVVAYCNPESKETANHRIIARSIDYARKNNKRIINLFDR